MVKETRGELRVQVCNKASRSLSLANLMAKMVCYTELYGKCFMERTFIKYLAGVQEDHLSITMNPGLT